MDSSVPAVQLSGTEEKKKGAVDMDEPKSNKDEERSKADEVAVGKLPGCCCF